MYLIAKVPEDISKKLDEVIQAKDLVPANMDLAGNIKSEYLIPEGKQHVYPLIFALIDEHKKNTHNILNKFVVTRVKKR